MATFRSRIWWISAIQVIVLSCVFALFYGLSARRLMATYQAGFEDVLRLTVIPAMASSVSSALYLYDLAEDAHRQQTYLQQLQRDATKIVRRFPAFVCTLAVYDRQGTQLLSLSSVAPAQVRPMDSWYFAETTGEYRITRKIGDPVIGTIWVHIWLPRYIPETMSLALRLSVGFVLVMIGVAMLQHVMIARVLTKPFRQVMVDLQRNSGVLLLPSGQHIDEIQDLVRVISQTREHLLDSQANMAKMTMQYATMFQAISDGIVVIWQDRIFFVNPAISKLLRKEVTDQQSVTDVFGEPIATQLHQVAILLWQKGNYCFEWEYVPKRIGRVTCVQIDWQSYPAVLLTLTDITAEHQREQQIKTDTERFRLSATTVFGDDLMGLPLKDALTRTKQFLIDQAVAAYGGDVQQAAAHLQVSDRTIYRRLRKGKNT